MKSRVDVRTTGVALVCAVLGVLAATYDGSSQVLSGHVGWRETTLFSDNFDTYLLGSSPPVGGWEVVWSGRGENKFVYGPSVSQPQSLELWGTSYGSAVVQRKFFTTAPMIGYEFAIRIEKIGTGTPGREESPGFFNRGAPDKWGEYYARVFFDHDTRQIKGEGGVVLGQWSPGVWYRVKVILFRGTAGGPPGLSVYSVWIDGQLVGQNIRTEGDTYRINALALFSGHPGVKVWYDDVRVFTIDQVATLTNPEWHIDFQGDYFHAGTYGQTGPVAHSQPGVHWNIFEVAALKEPFPTPRSTNPSLMLKEKGGLMTPVAFSIQGDAYGWAGWRGGHPLLDDYLIIYNAFGVTNNPTRWRITGLAPNTRYCLTFYHTITPPKRGLIFSIQQSGAALTVKVDHTSTNNERSVCVTTDGEGTITGTAAVDTGLGVEGNWAGLSIRVASADLVVESLTYNPMNPAIGQPIAFQVTVRNQGTAAAGAFVVRLQGAGPVRNVDVNGLAAGAAVNLAFNLPLSADPETFTATADVNNQVSESNETNNTRQVQVRGGQADLVVESITYSPLDPDVGDLVEFTVVVRNKGTAGAGLFVVRLSRIGATQDTPVSSLAAGASITLTFALRLSTKPQNFTATADVNNQVSESNEDNNTRQVQVPTRQADLVVESFTYEPLNPKIGDEVTFTVVVRNQGTGDAGSFVVRVERVGKSQDATVRSLPAGAATTLAFKLSTSANPQVFTATVDVNNQVLESDETNNIVQVVIYVVD